MVIDDRLDLPCLTPALDRSHVPRHVLIGQHLGDLLDAQSEEMSRRLGDSITCRRWCLAGVATLVILSRRQLVWLIGHYHA